MKCLIEQHADVNASFDNTTPLHEACLTCNWPLIELLLNHGARPTAPTSGTPLPMKLLPSKSDQVRYLKIATSIPADNKRPPRKCPCWSGKTLSRCHGDTSGSHSYPTEYPCICGSGKTYGACSCGPSRRNLKVVEMWDGKRITTGYSRVVTLKPDAESEVTLGFGPDCQLDPEMAWGLVIGSAAKLNEQGLIDPAVFFTLNKVGFLTRYVRVVK